MYYILGALVALVLFTSQASAREFCPYVEGRRIVEDYETFHEGFVGVVTDDVVTPTAPPLDCGVMEEIILIRGVTINFSYIASLDIQLPFLNNVRRKDARDTVWQDEADKVLNLRLTDKVFALMTDLMARGLAIQDFNYVVTYVSGVKPSVTFEKMNEMYGTPVFVITTDFSDLKLLAELILRENGNAI